MIRARITYLHTMYEVINGCTSDQSLENGDLINTVADIVLYHFEHSKEELFEDEVRGPIKTFAEKFEVFADASADLYQQPNYYLLMQELPEWAAVKEAATEAIRVFTDYMLSMGIIPGSIYAEQALRKLWQDYQRLVVPKKHWS